MSDAVAYIICLKYPEKEEYSEPSKRFTIVRAIQSSV